MGLRARRLFGLPVRYLNLLTCLGLEALAPPQRPGHPTVSKRKRALTAIEELLKIVKLCNVDECSREI